MITCDRLFEVCNNIVVNTASIKSVVIMYKNSSFGYSADITREDNNFVIDIEYNLEGDIRKSKMYIGRDNTIAETPVHYIDKCIADQILISIRHHLTMMSRNTIPNIHII
ncbi:MAG: hypothetical protein ACRCXT_10195 [Paraclostridium sp.]